VRALIVDDEPLARRRVAQLLAAESDVEIVGDAADGEEAVQLIEQLRPDLVFLDVQMPEVDGFDVLEAIRGEQMPAVIFATAFDQFALRAFDANAVDYLLKPYGEERFRAALGRARARLRAGRREEMTQQLHALLAARGAERRYPERLVVRVGPKLLFVPVADVDWVDVDGNYVRIHVGARSYLLRETLSTLSERLPPERFLRIHRSTLVNVERVREIQPMAKGTFLLRLMDGTALSSTLTYRDQIQALIAAGS